MKKIISIMLALVLALSMTTIAFATETGNNYTDKLNVAPVVPKKYQVNNGTAPAETFTFKFEGVSYVNNEGEADNTVTIPAIANVTISFDDLTQTTNKNQTVTINVNDYALGVYTYKVTEVAPTTKTTGVTYSEEELYLVLTILRDESGKKYVAAMHYQSATGTDKSTGFTNTYDSGSLQVTKEITGNMADMDKKFTFTITFTAPAGTQIKKAISTDATTGTWSEDGLTYTIDLGHNESVTLSNIPAGTTYTVTEEAGKYESTSSFSDDTKTISANDQDTVTFTNTLTSEIDTGIGLDSLPYVLMLVVVCSGAVVFFSKKRASREN